MSHRKFLLLAFLITSFSLAYAGEALIQQKLAFLLGLHARTGQRSRIRQLPVFLARKLLDYLVPTTKTIVIENTAEAPVTITIYEIFITQHPSGRKTVKRKVLTQDLESGIYWYMARPQSEWIKRFSANLPAITLVLEVSDVEGPYKCSWGSICLYPHTIQTTSTIAINDFANSEVFDQTVTLTDKNNNKKGMRLLQTIEPTKIIKITNNGLMLIRVKATEYILSDKQAMCDTTPHKPADAIEGLVIFETVLGGTINQHNTSGDLRFTTRQEIPLGRFFRITAYNGQGSNQCLGSWFISPKLGADAQEIIFCFNPQPYTSPRPTIVTYDGQIKELTYSALATPVSKT